MKSKEIPTLLFCRREIITERTAADERTNGVDRSHQQSQKAINRLLLSDNLYRKQKIPVCLSLLSPLSYLSPLQNPVEGVCPLCFATVALPPPSLLSPFRALFNPDLKIINQTIDQVLTMAWEAEGEIGRRS